MVICVETVPFGRTGLAEKNREPFELLEANGYFAFGDTYLNTIFVKEDAWRARVSQ